MARTAITPVVAPGAYLGETQAANSLDVVFTAADVANGNKVVATGKDLLLVLNSHATLAKTFTVTSFPDAQGRTAHIGPYTLQAGEYACVGPIPVAGWMQTDGNIYIDGESADIKFLVVRL